MVDAAAVGVSLSAAAEAFGASAAPVELRWGPLFEDLDGQGETEYASAVELIYEGYLLHYRESRACLPGAAREHSLLAGDFFYARGLRLIAARGDAAAVGLLARLMASCSYLRSVGASCQISVADRPARSAARNPLNALRRAASRGGGNPRNRKGSGGRPDSTSAVTAAFGPGIAVTGRPAAITARTRR